jgi:hypothetical protein
MSSDIHTNHNVYILGAGFSVPGGLPTIANFIDVMRDSIGWLEEMDVPMRPQLLKQCWISGSA